MHFLYVDESGDPGKHEEGISKNSQHFILTGLIVSQEDWKTYLDRLKIFRNTLKKEYGLLLSEEIHASELVRVNKIEAYRKITKQNRIRIFIHYIEEIPVIFSNSKIINVCFRKKEFETTKDIQTLAWSRLIQRFDTYLSKTVKDNGIIVTDSTDEKHVRNLLRKMRIYNPVPSHFGGSRNIPINKIIEDPFLRDSRHSYFIQTVDVIAHSLYRKEFPKGSLKKYNIHKLFEGLENLLLKEASGTDKMGIVRK